MFRSAYLSSENWSSHFLALSQPSYSEEALSLKYEPKFFDVPDEGQYMVKIYRGTKEIYSEQATITDSEPVYWVFA